MASFLGILLGLALLILGGGFLVTGASQLAARLGISPMIVGLTIVGFGTSAPELVVNVIGGLRGESALAFGNVIGSNVFNSLIVLPASALAGTVAIPKGGVQDLVVSWLFAAALIPIFLIGRARLGRTSGIMLLVAYAAYAVMRVRGF